MNGDFKCWLVSVRLDDALQLLAREGVLDQADLERLRVLRLQELSLSAEQHSPPGVVMFDASVRTGDTLSDAPCLQEQVNIASAPRTNGAREPITGDIEEFRHWLKRWPGASR